MKNLLISLFGILLYILSVYFTKTDRNGIEVYPIYYSAIIGGLNLVFTVLASVILWNSNFKLVVCELEREGVVEKSASFSESPKNGLHNILVIK